MTSSMKKLMAAAIVAGAPVAASAVELSGNVTMATDYSFRGVSQTEGKGAIQGGFDLDFGNGFYAGTWSSNVSYGNNTQELDVYAGYAFDVSESVALDFSVVQFIYPGVSSFNYTEYWATVSVSDFSLGLVYTNDYFGEGGEPATIVNLDYSLSVNESVSVDFHVGQTMLDQKGYYDSDDAYMDYLVGVNYDVADVTFTLAYVGTDIDDETVLGESYDSDGRLIFSISKSL